MRQPPTINDVAVAAQVSRQTVSNVLNSPAIVREPTRLRVEAVIAELGYRPHASARRLRTRHASTIAVRIDRAPEWMSGTLLDRFLYALTERADRQGQRLMLYTAQDADDEVRVISRLFDGSDVDAFVLTSTFLGDPRPKWLLEHGAAFVTFGRPWGIPEDDTRYLWVDVDGRFGTRAATQYLLDNGAKRVGFLGWPDGSGTGDDRRDGWRQAMLARGVAVPDELAALDESSVEDLREGRQAAIRLLDKGADAIVATSDTLALATIMVTDSRLPVVGFDNDPVAASMGFSSVDQRLDVVTEQVLRLLERGQTGEGPAHQIVQPQLVKRGGATSGAPHLSGWGMPSTGRG